MIAEGLARVAKRKTALPFANCGSSINSMSERGPATKQPTLIGSK